MALTINPGATNAHPKNSLSTYTNPDFEQGTCKQFRTSRICVHMNKCFLFTFKILDVKFGFLFIHLIVYILCKSMMHTLYIFSDNMTGDILRSYNIRNNQIMAVYTQTAETAA